MKQLSKLSSWLQQPSKNQFYSVSRREYYKNLTTPKDIEELIRRYKNPEKETVYSETNIRFNNIELGISLKSFMENNDSPRYEITNNYLELIKHTVLFYKDQIGKHKAFTQYHFINDILFWGVYLFNNKLDNNEILEIEKVLKSKYNIQDNVNFKNTLLTDINKNKLELTNEIFTTINYMSGNEKIISELEKISSGYRKLVKVETNKEKMNLFDKL